MPNNIEDYTIIIFSRNPYKRIVSGFLDKMFPEPNSYFTELYGTSKITFSDFVDELIKNDLKRIDKHHFTPQTSEKFDENIIKNAKKIKIMDIENINYNYIENIFNMKLTNELKNFKSGHERRFKFFENNISEYIYDIDLSEYINKNVNIKFFYNDIKISFYRICIMLIWNSI